MYSLNIPAAALRTKMRQEFERHRYVNQIGVVDMLLFQSHAEYQVRGVVLSGSCVAYGDGTVSGGSGI
jgi:isocitrate lyase